MQSIPRHSSKSPGIWPSLCVFLKHRSQHDVPAARLPQCRHRIKLFAIASATTFNNYLKSRPSLCIHSQLHNQDSIQICQDEGSTSCALSRILANKFIFRRCNAGQALFRTAAAVGDWKGDHTAVLTRRPGYTTTTPSLPPDPI